MKDDGLFIFQSCSESNSDSFGRIIKCDLENQKEEIIYTSETNEEPISVYFGDETIQIYYSSYQVALNYLGETLFNDAYNSFEISSSAAYSISNNSLALYQDKEHIQIYKLPEQESLFMLTNSEGEQFHILSWDHDGNYLLLQNTSYEVGTKNDNQEWLVVMGLDGALKYRYNTKHGFLNAFWLQDGRILVEEYKDDTNPDMAVNLIDMEEESISSISTPGDYNSITIVEQGNSLLFTSFDDVVENKFLLTIYNIEQQNAFLVENCDIYPKMAFLFGDAYFVLGKDANENDVCVRFKKGE